MTVQIINTTSYTLPQYKTEESAGMDLQAFIPEPIILAPMQRKLIATGLFVALPKGLEAQIRPRSGLALQHGITVLNSPGTIDSDYRGEIKILLINLGDESFTIQSGDRIAQMVVAAHSQIVWEKVDALSVTNRGQGGYGSTGI